MASKCIFIQVNSSAVKNQITDFVKSKVLWSIVWSCWTAENTGQN